jgi:response regulator RpfG family c-di-GMP phosphodiesterase
MMIPIEGAVGRMAVLVTAEDDEDIRMLVTRSLRKAGHREIRRDPELKHIPVVVVSGSLDSGDIAMEAGVTAIISKPFVPDALLHQLTEVLAHPSHRTGNPLT